MNVSSKPQVLVNLLLFIEIKNDSGFRFFITIYCFIY